MNPLKLRIDHKKMNVYLTIRADAGINKITTEMIKDYLLENGIVNGINEGAINKMIERGIIDRPIKVASGREPVNGEDGRVKFYFKTDVELKPKVLPDGSVDYRDLQLAQNAVKGQVLAERIPPTIGTPGRNVYGEEVPSEPGSSALLMAGKNTDFKDEAQNILVSQVEGSVKLRPGNRVVVDTVFRVEQNVDFSTGDLDVTGDVYINGNVISGFKVRATGNVVVNGLVEDAEITAGGDVLVRRGFIGTGKGIINAEGKVVTKFIDNQTINAGTEIHIGEEAFHSKLSAGKCIVMIKGHGKLVGGDARAGEFVEVNTIGSEQHVRTNVSVAENADLGGEIELIDTEIARLQERLEEVTERMMGIMERVPDAEMTDSQKRQLKSFDRSSQIIDEKINKMKEKKSMLVNDIENIMNNTCILVRRNIFPRTNLKIGWYSEYNNVLRRATEYRMGKDGLIIRSADSHHQKDDL